MVLLPRRCHNGSCTDPRSYGSACSGLYGTIQWTILVLPPHRRPPFTRGVTEAVYGPGSPPSHPSPPPEPSSSLTPPYRVTLPAASPLLTDSPPRRLTPRRRLTRPYRLNPPHRPTPPSQIGPPVLDADLPERGLAKKRERLAMGGGRGGCKREGAGGRGREREREREGEGESEGEGE